MSAAITRKSSGPADALGRYISAVRAFPPLSRAEEHAVALRARLGEVSARETLARHNLRLVIYIARRQGRWAPSLDDLIQEGNAGLMRAVERFDPEVGTRFSTYAVWWIRAYVGRYLKVARSAVRPRNGVAAQADLSLDSAVAADGDTTHLERISDEGIGPEDAYLRWEGDRQVRDALAKARNRIGAMGWDIVRTRLQHDPPGTLEEIGKRWGVSRERVRQVEVRTKALLRHVLTPAQLDAA